MFRARRCHDACAAGQADQRGLSFRTFICWPPERISLIRANGDPAHRHRPTTEARSGPIDPANFLAIFLACACLRPGSRFGPHRVGLLIQPAVRIGLAIPNYAASILGLVAGPGSLTFGDGKGASRRCCGLSLSLLLRIGRIGKEEN